MESLTSPGWEQSPKNLETEFKRLSRALDLIVEMNRRIFQISFDRDALLVEMLKGLRELVEAEYAQILLRVGNELEIVHSTHAADKGRRFRLDKCVCGLAVEKRGTIASGDVMSEYPDRYQWLLGEDQNVRMVSEVAVPIYAPALEGDHGQHHIVAGVINIESPTPDFFSDGKRELVEKFALQAGAAINNSRILTGLALTLRLAENIQFFDQQPEDALRNTLVELSKLFQEGTIVQFMLYDQASNSLVIESSTAPKTEGKRVLVDDSFSGLAIKNRGLPVRSNDVRRDYPDLFKDTLSDVGERPTQSELAVPIKADGRIIGVLNVESDVRDAFSRYDEYMLSVIAANASIWTRIYKSKSALALEKLATVGQVSGHLIHTVNNGLFRLSRIGENLKRIADRADPAVGRDLSEEILRLNEVPEYIQKSVNELESTYKQALEVHESVNINDVARRVADELITREDIRPEWDLDPGVPGLRISSGIYHVFWNLISNAQRAIKEGRPGVITIGTKIIYGQYTGQIEGYELYVADTGRGMSEEERAKATQLNYSTKKGRVTGYGLWWVSTFVDRWEGKLEIASEEGKGTCVRVRFPLPLTREGAAPHPAEENGR
jgi:signal transduction histidine kinase